MILPLESLALQVKRCKACPLRETATQPIPGIGEVGAKYMLIGEAPGREEDNLGVPFVGMAGKRLNKLLELARISSNDCYITNLIKCRPPENRTPNKRERLACFPWLRQELDLVDPQNIITLGAVPLSMFTEDGITQLHGTQQEARLDGKTVNLIPQYHPAASFRKPRLWAVMLDDWSNWPQKADSSYTVVDFPRRFPSVAALDTENDESGNLGQWSIAYRDDEGKICVASTYGPRSLIYPDLVVFHNFKWDARVLRQAGMAVPKNYVDTMVAAYCLGMGRQESRDSNRSGDRMVGGLGLKYLARRHLGMSMKSWKEVEGHPDLMLEYNAQDSVATLLLWEQWQSKVPKFFWEIDMPLLPVLMAMEDRGIKVDPDFLQEYAKTLDAELSTLDTQGINAFSHKQVAEYVYGTLGLPVEKFTPNKQPSVDSEVLEGIDDPLVKRILRYREVYHERGNYVSAYSKGLDLDNRIHCEFKQVSTATGRLSSSRPNLQNVTKGTELRKLFVAETGKLLVRVDWSQLELRVFAALTQERKMLEALRAGRSLHQETADALKLPYDDGKIVNFLMLYGGTPFAISQEFGVPIDEARALEDKYYKQFPGIKAYMAEQIEKAHRVKHVSNWYGRTRRLDGMFSGHWKTIKESEREGINMPVQGTAADLVKKAMVALARSWDAPMVLQVHDELLFEVEAERAPEYAQWLGKNIPDMTDTINGVNFPVEVGVGKNWQEAKERKVYG